MLVFVSLEFFSADCSRLGGQAFKVSIDDERRF